MKDTWAPGRGRRQCSVSGCRSRQEESLRVCRRGHAWNTASKRCAQIDNFASLLMTFGARLILH